MATTFFSKVASRLRSLAQPRPQLSAHALSLAEMASRQHAAAVSLRVRSARAAGKSFRKVFLLAPGFFWKRDTNGPRVRVYREAV